MQARVSRQLDVAISIANHPARTQIDLEVLRGAFDQPRFRFATVAVEAVRRLADGRVMRAIVDRVELRILEVTLELIVNVDDQVLGKVTTRDAGLVRDQDRQPAIVIQDPDRLRRIRKHAKTRGVIDVPNLLGNRAIAIDENCRVLHLHAHATESHKLLTVLSKLPRFNNACERSNTSSTVIAVMQRWSIGQSRSMHGAQSGGSLRISASGPKGRVVKGFVGPKITSVGRPSAAPMCAGPVSLVTIRSARSNTAVIWSRLVLPVSTTGWFCIRLTTSSETSISFFDPINNTFRPASINRSASAANLSGGQRFARLLIDPGQIATTDSASFTP